MYRRSFFVFAFALCFQSMAESQPTAIPLKIAHAHNDYYHDRPLLDALSNGFCSVEADIFLRDNELLVAHSANEIRKDRTLQKLYLNPLRDRCRAHGGRVYSDGPEFNLLIDIKSAGPETYRRLHQILSKYDDILSRVQDNTIAPKAVRVVISGNRPEAILAKQTLRYAQIDGRLSDLGTAKPIHLMPLISDRWTSHFKWRGRGEIPAEERKKLRSLVKQAHDEGRTIRFWATADTVAMWRELKAAKVDHINTDDLSGLSHFLRSP